MKKIPIIILMVLFLAATAFGYTGLNYNQPLSYTYSPTATTATTTTYTVLYSDDYVQCNATGGSYVLTLPTIASLHAQGFGSKGYKVIKTDASVNTCTITAGSGNTIGGETSRVLTTQNAFIVINAQAADWKVGWESPYISENHATGSVDLDALPTYAVGITIDDGVTDSPALTFTDATDETAVFIKSDGAFLGLTTVAADGLNVLVGNLKVGNGTPGVAQDGEDAYVEGTFEVDGATQFDGAVVTNSTITAVGAVTLDDGAGASPNFTLTDQTNETAIFSKVDSGYLTITTAAADGVGVRVGNLTVGDGTPDETINGEDLYCEGISEFDGTVNMDGSLTVGDAVTDGVTLTAAILGANPFILDGTTDDTNELTIAVADPGADYTLTIPATSTAAVMISALATNDVDAANSVWGVSGGIMFEGSGADASEATLTAANVTADVVYILPDAAAATYGIVPSTLSTNAVDIVNSVWGGTNQLIFEGTADGFETILTATDATASDKTATLPDATGTIQFTQGVGNYRANETTTAADTLTVADCGKTIFLNSAAEFQTDLPAPAAGCYFKFIVKAAPAGADYTIVTNASANIIIGGINENEVDTNDDGPYIANGDLITIIQSVAVVGDYVELISDGTSWYLEGQTNADGGITLGST